MTQFAKPFGSDRIADGMQALRTRVTRLEARTAGIDSGFPLMPLAGVIDPAYTSGDPRVLVNGSATLSGPYQHLASYTPAANDSVILLPVPALSTYVIIGKPV